MVILIIKADVTVESKGYVGCGRLPNLHMRSVDCRILIGIPYGERKLSAGYLSIVCVRTECRSHVLPCFEMSDFGVSV